MQEEIGLTYSQALTEIEHIVSDIESQEVDIDILTQRVRMASELIAFCRTRLRQTQEDVDSVFEERGLKQDGA